MTESLLLSGMGGFLGVLLVYGTLDLFLAKLPVFFRPMATDVVIDHRALAFSAALTVVVGMLFGLVLTAVGISGITAQSVARRRHEIGVRLAPGAERSQVVAMVVRQVILPVMIGLALTRVFAGLLFEIKPSDPVTFISVSVLSLVVALLSSYIPARRASRIDPMDTLRCE
jgi:putative ABC transport system permease protein